MEPFLGFIVLTGPLFLIVLWVPVCIALAVWIVRKKIDKGWNVKARVGFLVFVIALFIPVTDVIVDRVYLKYLCETKAEVKILQAVELPAKYWNEDGSPKFMNNRGVLDFKALDERFEWRHEDKLFSSLITKIHKSTWVLFDKRAGKILGEKSDFYSDGGWIEGFSPAPGRGASCRSVSIAKYGQAKYFQQKQMQERAFVQRIFIRAE